MLSILSSEKNFFIFKILNYHSTSFPLVNNFEIVFITKLKIILWIRSREYMLWIWFSWNICCRIWFSRINYKCLYMYANPCSPMRSILRATRSRLPAIKNDKYIRRTFSLYKFLLHTVITPSYNILICSKIRCVNKFEVQARNIKCCCFASARRYLTFDTWHRFIAIRIINRDF